MYGLEGTLAGTDHKMNLGPSFKCMHCCSEGVRQSQGCSRSFPASRDHDAPSPALSSRPHEEPAGDRTEQRPEDSLGRGLVRLKMMYRSP